MKLDTAFWTYCNLVKSLPDICILPDIRFIYNGFPGWIWLCNQAEHAQMPPHFHLTNRFLMQYAKSAGSTVQLGLSYTITYRSDHGTYHRW
mgnify:CR=1 FL=1